MAGPGRPGWFARRPGSGHEPAIAVGTLGVLPDVSPGVLLQALLLALAAALLAGIYPAFKMSRTSPALALREE